jgi:hypothetical protein
MKKYDDPIQTLLQRRGNQVSKAREKLRELHPSWSAREIERELAARVIQQTERNIERSRKTLTRYWGPRGHFMSGN